ncbi:MAG: class II aldolase/adducin family protein [Spongiibacter sp.]|nr:class II aldolase/adducin family protein [Spongiibacter sp.]
MNDEAALRRSLAHCLREMAAGDLSPGASGNISARWRDGMLVSASGLKAASATADDFVFVEGDSTDAPLYTGSLRPSSEWLMHLRLYQCRPATQAIVHCHSPFATALACKHLPIPAFHYMVSIAGGDSIPCCDYALFGTEQLAEQVALALTDRTACLMANHGQISVGDTPQRALALAAEVESLARMYLLARQGGEPELLDREQMMAVFEKFRGYGQRL